MTVEAHAIFFGKRKKRFLFGTSVDVEVDLQKAT